MSTSPLGYRELFQLFSFPLSAYAWCLLRETGQPRGPSFGVFETLGDSIGIAQDHLIDLIAQSLPPPCRLLEVGIGLGEVLVRLKATGYDAQGITPGSDQVRAVRALYGGKLAVSDTSYESFCHRAGSWDVLLFRESSHQIDLLDLFSRASMLLKPAGEMLLAGIVALKRADNRYDSFHLVEHINQLGERFGFQADERIDISHHAVQMIEVFIDMFERYQKELIHEMCLSKDQIGQLIVSLYKDREDLSGGWLAYRVLKFRRLRQPSATLGWIGPEHAAEVRALFESVFGNSLSPAMWQWKYGQNRGRAVGVWQAGRLVAHYGGLTRPILYFGRECLASQSVDVMALRSARSALGRQSPFFSSVATYLEQAIGYGRRHLVGFGFPSFRHLRAAVLLGLYDGPVGEMREVTWKLSRFDIRQFIFRSRRLNLSSSKDRQITEYCWQEMKKFGNGFVIGIRDTDWLLYRFANHPEYRYEIHAVLCFWQRRPFGIVVVRKHSDGRLEWVDAIAAPSRIRWLFYGLKSFSVGRAREPIFAWIVEDLIPFFPTPASVTNLAVGIPNNRWTVGPPAKDLQGRWWLMGGDTDFR